MSSGAYAQCRKVCVSQPARSAGMRTRCSALGEHLVRLSFLRVTGVGLVLACGVLRSRSHDHLFGRLMDGQQPP